MAVVLVHPVQTANMDIAADQNQLLAWAMMLMFPQRFQQPVPVLQMGSG